MRVITLLVLLALAAPGLGPTLADAADPIKFGFSAPLTSPIAFIAVDNGATADFDIADDLDRDKPVRLDRGCQVIFRRIPEMDFDHVIRLNAVALFARRESGFLFSGGIVRRGAGGYRNAQGHSNRDWVETHPYIFLVR